MTVTDLDSLRTLIFVGIYKSINLCVCVCVCVCGLLIFTLTLKMHDTPKFQRIADISTVKSFEVMEVMSTLELVVFPPK